MAHILVTDDTSISRELLAETLTRHGNMVSTAANGHPALKTLNSRTVDLLLLDVRMPVLDGLAVLRAMRRNPRLNHIPVILLTDDAQRSTVAEAARVGAAGYMLKSAFVASEMLERVDSCLAAGVIYGRTAAALPARLTALEMVEHGRGLDRLGVVGLCDAGNLTSVDEAFSNRHAALLQTPVRHDQLMRSFAAVAGA